jgi:hypothetical protein
MRTFLPYAVCLLALATFPQWGCASKAPASPTQATVQKPQSSGVYKFPRVKLNQDYNSLDMTVRQVGEKVGGGLVTMCGVGDRPLPPMSFKHKPYGKFAAQLASLTQCACESTPYYYFLYAPGYESLLSIALSNRLTPRYQTQSAAIAFGANTKLYNIFTTMNRTLGITILADNTMAESTCGEFFLPDMPLPLALEAVFKSARISPDGFEVESTDDYIFFRSKINRTAPSTLLNEDALNNEQRAAIEQRVTVTLPETPSVRAGVAFYNNATTLQNVLAPLSAQLGVKITAEAKLNNLPVTPSVINNVPLRTAMDLLVRQWPVPQFGWVILDNHIVILSKETFNRRSAQPAATSAPLAPPDPAPAPPAAETTPPATPAAASAAPKATTPVASAPANPLPAIEAKPVPPTRPTTAPLPPVPMTRQETGPIPTASSASPH